VLSRIRGIDEAEFAVLISDRFERWDVGSVLLKRLLQVAPDEAIDRIFGIILPENVETRRVCDKLGFQLIREVPEAIIDAPITT
jgi:acetyltransferase